MDINNQENNYSQYRTDMYYKCFGEYAYIPKDEDYQQNYNQENTYNNIICDNSCLNLDSCW